MKTEILYLVENKFLDAFYFIKDASCKTYKVFQNDFLKVFKKLNKYYFFFKDFSNVYILSIYSKREINKVKEIINEIIKLKDALKDNKKEFKKEIENLFKKYRFDLFRYLFIIDKNEDIKAILISENFYFRLKRLNKRLFKEFKNTIQKNDFDKFLKYCAKKNYEIIINL